MKSLSFKKKLCIAFIIVGIIPLISLTIYNYIYIASSTKKNIEDFTQNNLQIAANLIDNDINTFTNMVNFVSSSEEVQAIMSKDYRYISSNERFDSVQKLYTITRTITATQPIDVIPVHIINTDKTTRFSTTKYYSPIYQDDRGNFYEKMLRNEGNVVTQIHRRVDGDSSKDIVMVIGKALVDKKNNNTHIGYVVADFYDSYFDNILNNATSTNSSNIYLLDNNGYIITDKIHKNQAGFAFPLEYQDQLKKKDGSFHLTLDGKKYNCYFTTSKTSHIKVIELIPKNYFLDTALKNSSVFIGITLIVILLAISVLTIFSNKISRPISSLSETMNQVELGNRDVRVSFIGDDEIGKLGKSFNDMIDEINRLIDEDYKKQLLIHQAEFKALKSQVNPHFLYNALNSINWMAKLGDMNGVCNMTSALSRFFRYSVNNSTDIVPLNDEIEQIKNYLIIQSYRYKDKFTTSIDIDENILNCKVLKLILQPLVENAVIHGLEQQIGTGKIIIRGYCEDNDILLEICDNGIGLGNSSFKGEGIGIDNVRKRIKLYYGENYDLTYCMRDDYTVFKINFPKEEYINND